MNLADADCTAIEVRASGLHGHGAFAAAALARGAVLGHYAGRRHPADEVHERDWDHATTHVFGLSDGSVIDGAEGGNATRFLNHSCTPNCIAFEIEDGAGQAQIQIETRRRIKAGTELTLDYGLAAESGAPADYPCRCGTPRCRGTLLAAA
jgi:SET domain-containing protein